MDWGQVDLLLEDWTTFSVANRLSLPAPWVSRFADTASGSALAAVTSEPDYLDRNRKRQFGSTYLVIWDIANGRELLRVKQEMKDYSSKFSLIAVTRELRLTATSSHHDHVDVWDAFTGKRLKSFDTGSEVTALALSDDGALLATGHSDGRVYIWNTRDASERVDPVQQQLK
jgi:WD40 repeat protein